MNTSFFISNRQRLVAALKVDVVILAANSRMQQGNDSSYTFQQESNFWYLTGIDAPDWWVIITVEKTYLVAPDVEEVHRIFDGSLSNKDAKGQSGVDVVVSCAEGKTILKGLQGKSIATLGEHPHKEHFDFALNAGPVDMHLKLVELYGTVQDCRSALSKLRSIKQPQEIQLIRESIDLTIDGFERVKGELQSYTHEYQIEADFTHHFRRNGASGHAYDPIVAAGKNACTLHYGKNRAALTSGVFVLLDVGASKNGYPADITRTYGFGEISDRQRAVHAEVEKAHLAIIELLGPGKNVKEYFGKVDEIMQAALVTLGLMKSPNDYRKYFPHSISHGLGIDVHDSLGGPETFQPGMILTVEPGIYIPEERIGVRIEDDILITETGYENLSAALPTTL